VGGVASPYAAAVRFKKLTKKPAADFSARASRFLQ